MVLERDKNSKRQRGEGEQEEIKSEQNVRWNKQLNKIIINIDGNFQLLIRTELIYLFLFSLLTFLVQDICRPQRSTHFHSYVALLIQQ